MGMLLGRGSGDPDFFCDNQPTIPGRGLLQIVVNIENVYLNCIIKSYTNDGYFQIKSFENLL